MSPRAAGLLAALALVLTVPVALAAPPTWQSRVASAARYADTRTGAVSFAVVDESGTLRGYRMRTVVPSASVLKAMLLVAYLRKADVRGRALQQWERDLLAPMIRRSDNAAASRMVGLVGETGLNRLARVAGMEHFRLHWPIWGQSEITARGQARFLFRIESLLPSRHRAYALGVLATVVSSQRWGVGRVSHRGWRLYFKGGWGSGTGLVDHQVALYAAGGERFSLALLTRLNPDHEYGKETLRGLASRLLAGIPHPLAPGQRMALFAADGGYAAAARTGCGSLRLTALGRGTRTVATGASGCEGVQLALGGAAVLWSRAEGGGRRLATASYGNPAPADLGSFGSLGPLASGGTTLAYADGGRIAVAGGPSCSSPNAIVAADGGRIAGAAGSAVEVRVASSCALIGSLNLDDDVRALALDGDRLAVLLGGRIDVYRISTGARVTRAASASATLPALAVHGGWVAYRAPHALRVLSVATGRTWTLWRPRRALVGAGLAGSRLAWAENGPSAGSVWLLRLPPA